MDGSEADPLATCFAALEPSAPVPKRKRGGAVVISDDEAAAAAGPPKKKKKKAEAPRASKEPLPPAPAAPGRGSTQYTHPEAGAIVSALKQALQLVDAELQWLRDHDFSDAPPHMAPTRLVDYELFLSAVDMCVVESRGDVRAAAVRLGLDPAGLQPEAESLIRSRADAKVAVAEVRRCRGGVLRAWSMALTLCIDEVAKGSTGKRTAPPLVPDVYFAVPTPVLHATPPRADVTLPTPSGKGKGKGPAPPVAAYPGARLTSMKPREWAQVLHRRAWGRQKHRVGLSADEVVVQEVKAAEAGFDAAVRQREERVVETDPLQWEPPYCIRDGGARAQKRRRLWCYTPWTACHDVAVLAKRYKAAHGDPAGRLQSIGKQLVKQEERCQQMAEKEAEARRQRVGRALKSALCGGFWARTASLRKNITKEFIAKGRRRILEAKKSLLIDEASSLTRELQSSIKVHFSGTSCADVPHPPLLKGEGRTLRSYQKAGVNWLVALAENGLSGILADEMGLGKTIQTIALLTHLASAENNYGPHLIVVPTSVMLNWEIEFKRWAPGFKLLMYYGSQAQRQAKRKGWGAPGAFDVCVTSYNLVNNDQKYLQKFFWEYLILDEAHLIKNWRSKKWQVLQKLRTSRRLLLSGTPLQNNMMEIWSLLRFLMHENPLFSSHSNFHHWFNSPMTSMLEEGVCDTRVVEELHTLLRPYFLRRTKREVESEMPKKIEKVIRCPLSRRQRTLYDEYLNRSSIKATLEGGAYISVMGVLMALRKCCNHPDLFEARPIISPFCPWYTSIPQPDHRRHTVPPVRGTRLPLPALLATLSPLAPAKADVLLRNGLQLVAPDVHTRVPWYASPALPDAAAPTPPSEVRRAVLATAPPGWGAVVDGLAEAGSSPSPGLGAYVAHMHRLVHEQQVERADAAATMQKQRILHAAVKGVWACTPLELMQVIDHRRPRYGSSRVVVRDASGAVVDKYACSEMANPPMYARLPPWAEGSVYERDASGGDWRVSTPPLAARGASARPVPVWSRHEVGFAEVALLFPTAVGVARAWGVWEEMHGYASLSPDAQYAAAYNARPALSGWWNQLSTRGIVARFGAMHVPKVLAGPVEMAVACALPGRERRAPHTVMPGVDKPTGVTLPPSKGLFRALHPQTPALNWLNFPDPRLLVHDCGKLQVLAALLPKLKLQGHRVLIFTQMARVLDILEAFLSTHGHVYLRLDGSTHVEERQYKMDQFNNDTRFFCFILSTRSGGVGINLTGADTVVFYDSDWNPAMDLQAQDRCHRIGQTRDVTVYRLTSKHTVEENILVRARQKKTLVNLVIRGGKFNESLAVEREKTNVMEFFHHLDEDELLALQKAEDGEEQEAPPDDAQAALLAENPLVELEEDVDRQAYQKVRAELANENAEFDDKPADTGDGIITEGDLTPLEHYAIRAFDEFSPVHSEAVLTQADGILSAFRSAEFKDINESPVPRTPAASRTPTTASPVPLPFASIAPG
eukprot:TRINITY_DN19229_c0_g1_i1.p1 TRINITY_DN19229_c0_g1~~TRINITY_DN19229_c0_g1_i1.p1  ORF type:complete len:1486 (+),score=517.43 TRINITY_DN19229_c0_g1_i1:117-4574(+)